MVDSHDVSSQIEELIKFLEELYSNTDSNIFDPDEKVKSQVGKKVKSQVGGEVKSLADLILIFGSSNTIKVLMALLRLTKYLIDLKGLIDALKILSTSPAGVQVLDALFSAVQKVCGLLALDLKNKENQRNDSSVGNEVFKIANRFALLIDLLSEEVNKINEIYRDGDGFYEEVLEIFFDFIVDYLRQGDSVGGGLREKLKAVLLRMELTRQNCSVKTNQIDEVKFQKDPNKL